MKLLRMNCTFVFSYSADVVITYVAALLNNSAIIPVHRVGVKLTNTYIIIMNNSWSNI